MSAPFVVGDVFRSASKVRWFLNGADTIFDVGYLLLAVIFSDEESFGNSVRGLSRWLM